MIQLIYKYRQISQLNITNTRCLLHNNYNIRILKVFLHDLCNSSNLPVLEPDFDSARMIS